MLGIFKRLLGRKAAKSDEIPFSSIDFWFETKLKNTTLSKDIASVFNEIEQALSILNSSLKKIAQKMLDVPKENKDAVEQSREDYLDKMHGFAKQITIDRKDPESIINYAESLSVALKHVKDETKNQLPVIERLFTEQNDEIDQQLEDLKDLSAALNDLVKQELGVIYIYDVKKKISSIRKKKKTAEELKQLIEKEKIKSKAAEEHKIRLETDIDDLKTMSEYEKYDQLVSQRIRIEKDMERDASNIKLMFSKLSKILNSYGGEVEFNKELAKSYAKDPLNALNNDKELWIMNILEIISSKLNETELDEEKRVKTREAITRVNADSLKSYLSKQSSSKETLEQLRRQLALSTTTLKMEDIKYKMSHALEQAEACNENIKKHEKAISELEIEKDLLMLEKKLSLLGSIRIT